MGFYEPDDSRIVHETHTDLTLRDVPEIVHIVQYDDKLPIVAVELRKNGQKYCLPERAQVKVRFGKPDRTFVYTPILGWNYDCSVIYFELNVQMTMIAGVHYPNIEIAIDGNLGCSAGIPIMVDTNSMNKSMLESMSEYVGIEQMAIDIRTKYEDFIPKYETVDEKTKTAIEYGKKAIDAASRAATSERNAKISETNAKTSEEKAATSETNAKASEEAAKTSETNAATHEANAEASATSIGNAEAICLDYKEKAAISETNAKTSEEAAKTSEENAKASEEAAKTSEENAKTSEENAMTAHDEVITEINTYRQQMYDGVFPCGKGEKGDKGDKGDPGQNGSMITAGLNTETATEKNLFLNVYPQDASNIERRVCVKDDDDIAYYPETVANAVLLKNWEKAKEYTEIQYGDDLGTAIGKIQTGLDNSFAKLESHQEDIDYFGRTINDVQTRVEECFQNASNGKSLIASAITGKGVSVSADSTFSELADAISSISYYKTYTYQGTPTGSMTSYFYNGGTQSLNNMNYYDIPYVDDSVKYIYYTVRRSDKDFNRLAGFMSLKKSMINTDGLYGMIYDNKLNGGYGITKSPSIINHRLWLEQTTDTYEYVVTYILIY